MWKRLDATDFIRNYVSAKRSNFFSMDFFSYGLYEEKDINY